MSRCKNLPTIGVTLLAILIAQPAHPIVVGERNSEVRPQPVIENGSPALAYPIGGDCTVEIRAVQENGERMFEIESIRLIEKCLLCRHPIDVQRGRLLLSRTKLRWISSDDRQGSFDYPNEAVKFKTDATTNVIQIEASGSEKQEIKPLQWMGPSARPGCKGARYQSVEDAAETLADWLQRGAADFRSAMHDFDSLTVSLHHLEFVDFEAKATAWRAAGRNVTLSEDAERHRTLAETAYQDRDFERAVAEYHEGLKIYPTWPQAQFNIALLLAELQQYAAAVDHMKAYLQLLPDAANAQDAKQQIWVWQDKMK